MARAFALAILLLASVGTVGAKPLEIVASFTVLADVVRQVGGDRVAVRSLVPPNGDVHEFEPAPEHARALKSADLVFTSGLGLEPWFDRLARAAGLRKPAVAVSTQITPLRPNRPGQPAVDPHVWNDPHNVMVWAKAVADALAAADPVDAETFRRHADAFIAQLQDADRDAHARIDPISTDRRRILTSHDAFAYFARAYGVTFLAPVGVSTDAEPSAAAIAKLIDQIRRENIKMYFLENSGSPRLIKTIAAATGAAPGGTLYVESLSDAAGPAATYLAMFRHNVDLLVAAMAR